MAIIKTMAKEGIQSIRRLVAISQMPGAYMTCMEMLENGAWIGMTKTMGKRLYLIQSALIMDCIVYYEEVAGIISVQKPAVQRVGAGVHRHLLIYTVV